MLAVASVVVFAYGVARPIAKYRRGRGRAAAAARASWPGALLARPAAAALARDDRAPRPHRRAGRTAAIFYGFIVLFAGTVILGFDTDFTDPVFGWNYFHGDFYLAYKEVLNVLGTALIAGVLVMMVRRAIVRPRQARLRAPRPRARRAAVRPPRLPRRRLGVRRDPAGDRAAPASCSRACGSRWTTRATAARSSAAGSSRRSSAGSAHADCSPGCATGSGGSTACSRSRSSRASRTRRPRTCCTSFFVARAARPARRQAAARRSRPSARPSPPATATLADFSPLHLLQLDACTKCGRCHEACPANATGRPLSPRDVILELREQANAAARRPASAACSAQLLARRTRDRRAASRADVVGADGVRAETVWSCMQCNACVEICPVGIEQAPIINQLRRRLVEEGELDPNLQSTLEAIHKSGNSFGENRRKRGRWTDELDFEVKDARKEPVDVLWFVGDYASFDPRSQRVTRALARIFHARRRRLRDPLRRRAQLRQRRAPGRRGGAVRVARRAEHRDALRAASSTAS